MSMIKKKDRSVKISHATYARICRIGKSDKRSIKAVIELALDCYEGLAGRR